MENSPQHKRIDPINKLFVNYHNGDRAASDQLANRFELWFDSLTTFYLGDHPQRKASYDRVCETFSKNIHKIKRSRDLIPFAHDILSKEIKQFEETNVADFTNHLLKNQSAPDLLQKVWAGMDKKEQHTLLGVYMSQGKGEQEYPYAALAARNKLKTLLQQQCGVEFITEGDRLDWDLCPLPLYEGKKLKNKQEIQYFEKWLLNAPAICKEILEFSPFIHALRNGAIQPVKEEVIEKTENDITDVIDPVEDFQEVDHYDIEEGSNTNALLKPIVVAVGLFLAIAGLFILLNST
jgi:hypothetical protein